MLLVDRQLIAGLDTEVIGDRDASACVVFVHGYAMTSADFSPFAQSLGLSGQYWFPNAPLRCSEKGFTWWQVDPVQRAAAFANGPRDVRDIEPVDRTRAQQQLDDFLREIAPQVAGRPLILAGFSQGAMMLVDYLLCYRQQAAPDIAGIALLSTSLIAWHHWQPQLCKFDGLPALVSHGTHDQNFPISAGCAVRDALIAGGAHTQWLEFDGGHTVPLLVWRALRRFIIERVNSHPR
jgi:phospholipase/carboxylesterase